MSKIGKFAHIETDYRLLRAGERRRLVAIAVMSMSFPSGMVEMFWNWICVYVLHTYFAGISKYLMLRILLQKVNYAYCVNATVTVQRWFHIVQPQPNIVHFLRCFSVWLSHLLEEQHLDWWIVTTAYPQAPIQSYRFTISLGQ